MAKTHLLGFQVLIIPENGSFSAWAPEIDIASQGETKEEALSNLKEAIELNFESMNPYQKKEVESRMEKREITLLKVEVGA